MKSIPNLVKPAAVAMSIAAGMAVQPASAITCRGPDQLVDGNWIGTPYCQDNYIAQVARNYGMQVSNRAVRQNPSLRSEICYRFGHDIRISSYCLGDRPEGRPFFR